MWAWASKIPVPGGSFLWIQAQGSAIAPLVSASRLCLRSVSVKSASVGLVHYARLDTRAMVAGGKVPR
jgi:hypothetical protein